MAELIYRLANVAMYITALNITQKNPRYFVRIDEIGINADNTEDAVEILFSVLLRRSAPQFNAREVLRSG